MSAVTVSRCDRAFIVDSQTDERGVRLGPGVIANDISETVTAGKPIVWGIGSKGLTGNADLAVGRQLAENHKS